MSTLNFNVSGNPHNDQPSLIADNPPGGTTLATHFEGVPGQPPNRFIAAVPPSISGAATLHYQHDKSAFRVILPPGEGVYEAGLPPCLPPEYHGDSSKVVLAYGASVGESVQVIGDHFELDGQPWVWAMGDGFCDAYYWLNGQQQRILDCWKQSQDLGCRGRRLFMMMRNIIDFNPDAYGEAFYGVFGELCERGAEYGQYFEFDIFPDAQLLGWSLGKCQDHWARVNNVMRPLVNRFVSLTNEYDHGGNLVGAPNDYARPPGGYASQGSAVSDAPPPRPGWDWREFHCAKDWPKIYLFEDELFNGLGVDADGHRWGDAKPIVYNEGPRFDEVNPFTDEKLARSHAHSSLGIGCGMTLHSDDGKYSRILQPRQARCLAAAMAVLNQ